MNPAVFVKGYTDPARGVAARAHLAWLAQLDSGIRLPEPRPGGTASQLVLEHLDGRTARPADLEQVAAALGQLHATAHARELHAASLDRKHTTSTGLVIPSFRTSREHALAEIGVDITGLAAAFYKDSNLRNVIITASGPALVDFDDLTLAPFGYDLAKLVVSTAMTHGRVPARRVQSVLDAYNNGVHAAACPPAACTWPQFAAYAELHNVLTAPYLGHNGYRYPWPAVRPWPCPNPWPLDR